MKTTNKTLYEKQGNKFVPVGRDDIVGFYPFGDYLIRIRKNSKKVNGLPINLKIDHVKTELMIADARDAIAEAIYQEGKIKPTVIPLSKREQKAWKEWYRIMGKKCYTYTLKNVGDIADSAVILLRRSLYDSTCPESCLEVFAESQLKGKK